MEWSLDGSLPKNLPVIPTSNQMVDKLNIEKRGRKSSPLKLLSPSQPSFAEMILAWSRYKLSPAFQVSDQDGRLSRT
jgi:hypothetical protein